MDLKTKDCEMTLALTEMQLNKQLNLIEENLELINFAKSVLVQKDGGYDFYFYAHTKPQIRYRIQCLKEIVGRENLVYNDTENNAYLFNKKIYLKVCKNFESKTSGYHKIGWELKEKTLKKQEEFK